MYWPVELMLPALLGLMVQFTVALAPFMVAVNCWSEDAFPEESVQPVQLVSMVAVPGEIFRPPPPPVPPPLELPPPQPATASARGSARNRHERNEMIRVAARPWFTRGPGFCFETCEACGKELLPGP